jgi:hypothetical protein
MDVTVARKTEDSAGTPDSACKKRFLVMGFRCGVKRTDKGLFTGVFPAYSPFSSLVISSMTASLAGFPS